mgnify:CR=1
MPQLTWLGDTEAKRAARRVPYGLLESVEFAMVTSPEHAGRSLSTQLQDVIR